MKPCRVVAGLALWIGLSLARVQGVVEVPSAALDCPAPTPEARAHLHDPERELLARGDGTVRVDLVFSDAAQSPRVIDRSPPAQRIGFAADRSRISLKLPSAQAHGVLGPRFDVRVPCGNVNL